MVAAAVVGDIEEHGIVEIGQGKAHLGGLGVLGDVRQRLLCHPIKGRLSVGSDVERRTDGVQLGVHARILRPGVDQRRHRNQQGRSLQLLRSERLHRASRVGEVRPGQRTCQLEVAGQPARVRPSMLGGPERRDDPGQTLGVRVVNLAGETLSLVDDAESRA